jgi:hypothetical protein
LLAPKWCFPPVCRIGATATSPNTWRLHSPSVRVNIEECPRTASWPGLLREGQPSTPKPDPTLHRCRDWYSATIRGYHRNTQSRCGIPCCPSGVLQHTPAQWHAPLRDMRRPMEIGGSAACVVSK